MDRGGESGTSSPGGNLIESKTRNYVARPGTSSRFSLRGGAVGRQKTAGATDGTFAGVYPPGAQYDTAADLIYAIRNGGADVAIWTAAPSSTLPGPDDYAVDGEGIGDVTNGKQLHAKKRKPHQQRDTVTSADALVSVRLRIPGGKNAATLTPFTIPTSSSKGMAPPAAVGAAGCCEDGSIWVAIRFRSNENWGTFQILIVERSSNDEMEANGARSDMKSTKRRKAAADVNDEHEKNGWRILDSCATGTMDNASVLLTIQSMMLSRDKAEVSFRTHQVRINNNDNEEQHASVHIERFAKQNILQLETSESDVAIKLYADSLLIVHRKKNGRWMFTSVNLSGSDGALIDSTRTFPLPLDQMECATVFSFGRVGKDIIAILIKCRGNCPEAFLMSLRVIDFRRKAELSSVSWVEGDVSMIDDTSSIKDSRMTKMLHDKPCRAMITNELDGSIALLTSSKGGSLVIVSSKVQLSSSTPQSAPMASTFVSLASALRLVATSLSPPGEARALTLMAGLNSNLSKISSGADVFPNQNVVYDATDIFVASELLVSSAKQLIKHAESSARNRLLTNGNSKKVSNASDETNAHSISWKQVYQDSCTLITKIKGEKHNHSKRMVNGIKRGVSTVKTLPVTTYDIPKGFVEMAFKETAAVLLSLHGATAPANNQSEFRGVSQEAACVLVDVLQTNHISARADYGLRSLHREHVFLSILRACPSVSLTDAGSKTVGKLHVLDAMLKHVLDVPESALVSILRLLIRNASVDDAVTYYATAPETSKRGIVLSNRYKAMSDTQEDERNHIGAKLLSEAVLDFTSKVVTYSSCNHSFLTKAMRDSINTSGEVETLLLTLSKLLRVGGTRELQEEVNDSSKQVNLSLGTIQWITALTDAHMGTILTITNNGGLVIDRIQRAVRSAMAQSEFASELRKILDHVITGGDSMNFEAKYVDHNSSPTDTAIMPYTVERLAF
ncbi:hypothetical protein ACHAW5_000479 [Stephanodiscus triporus]|uniref:Uncharacterized protein n=1 Tax=Stephanodiscus triporus TaxID=2934178 RepID=A0ABD3MKZ1_9STRA